MRVACYVSGHGYGHSTRVAALAEALLDSLFVSHLAIVTRTPRDVFGDLLARPDRAASYRCVECDPVIVQPRAYSVDRAQTVASLGAFLEHRPQLLQSEADWLTECKYDLVLSDSVFLACAAAARAGIPSIIVSNFTFDSIYSYLSHPSSSDSDPSDPPISPSLLDPLVAQVLADYSSACLLLRLPGAIPIPAFDGTTLPAGAWMKPDLSGFTDAITASLARPVDGRRIIEVPLVTRKVHSLLATAAGRTELRGSMLRRMGVPPELRSEHTRVALISFGGQFIPPPPSACLPSDAAPVLSTLLPDGWIAILCGQGKDTAALKKTLPPNFFCCEYLPCSPPSAIEEVYLPDLTAIADVVLGKLGYSTLSEVICSHTAMIYVPRPLFIEEPGLLALLLHHAPHSTTRLSREDFEAGRWRGAIQAAWEGREREANARKENGEEGRRGIGAVEVVVNEIQRFMSGRG